MSPVLNPEQTVISPTKLGEIWGTLFATRSLLAISNFLVAAIALIFTPLIVQAGAP